MTRLGSRGEKILSDMAHWLLAVPDGKVYFEVRSHEEHGMKRILSKKQTKAKVLTNRAVPETGVPQTKTLWIIQNPDKQSTKAVEKMIKSNVTTVKLLLTPEQSCMHLNEPNILARIH